MAQADSTVFPARARSILKGDTIRCSAPEIRDQVLHNATSTLMEHLSTIYLSGGYGRPEIRGFGMGLPAFASGGGVLPSDLELFLRLAALPHFRERRSRINIFCVGNSFGYSTLALALVFGPRARVAALDAHETRHGKDSDVANGTSITRRLARLNGLNVRVHVGTSPFDVGDVLRHEGMAQSSGQDHSGAIDLAFIDGAHTDQNQWDDFAALRRHMRRGSGIIVLHDVTLSRMYRSLHAIQVDVGTPARIYRSINHCNEFGTVLIAPGAEPALPSGLGPVLGLPKRSSWHPILAPTYPAAISARSSLLSGDLQLDEEPRPDSRDRYLMKG